MTEFAGLYRPDWTLPAGVHAFVSTREGGRSGGPFESFNLAPHVQDDPAAVEANRQLLQTRLGQAAGTGSVPVQWLQQVHGTDVFRAGATPVSPPQADAIYGREPGLALSVLTADCLPVLFCSDDGGEIAVAHAGWRGLLGGVLEATLAHFRSSPASISAWLGPAIGPCHFEVGEEVRAAFLGKAADQAAVEAAFAANGKPGKWLADLYALARIRLEGRGLRRISGGPVCTVCHHERFYSYRHQRDTGRFATLIFRAS